MSHEQKMKSLGTEGQIFLCLSVVSFRCAIYTSVTSG